MKTQIDWMMWPPHRLQVSRIAGEVDADAMHDFAVRSFSAHPEALGFHGLMNFLPSVGSVPLEGLRRTYDMMMSLAKKNAAKINLVETPRLVLVSRNPSFGPYAEMMKIVFAGFSVELMPQARAAYLAVSGGLEPPPEMLPLLAD